MSRKKLRTALHDLADAEQAVYDARQAAMDALAIAIDSEMRRRRLTLSALAKHVGVSKAHLCDLLHRRRFSPSVARFLTTPTPSPEPET